MDSRCGRIRLAESIEHERQHFSSNTHAGISNLNLRPIVTLRSATVTRPSTPVNLTAFDSTFQNTCCSRCGSAKTGWTPSSKCVSSRTRFACIDGRTESSDAAENRTHIERFHREHHLARNDARDIENVLDQPKLRFGIALDNLDCVRRVPVELTHSQDPRPPVHGVEWRPQFVGERAEEFVLDPIRLLRLTIKFDPVQRGRLRRARSSRMIRPEPANRAASAAPNESAAVRCPCATKGKTAKAAYPDLVQQRDSLGYSNELCR